MLWKQEIELIDELSKKITNLGSDISKQVTQFESRKATLENELVKLEGDFIVITARNEEAKKEFAKSRRLDLEQFEEARRRTQQRELLLIEKEKIVQLRISELEAEIASAKSTKHTMEALGRNHGKK